jgi:hypothetical protein
MLTAQIGLINPTDYWSTARSGGQDGLGGCVDWHIEKIAAIIENQRRQGISDAQTTKDLVSGALDTGILGGATAEMINAAFAYLATGKFPAGTECLCPAGEYAEACCPKDKTGSKRTNPWIWIGGTVAVIGTIAGIAWAVRRRR